jgi:hypothetical protein
MLIDSKTGKRFAPELANALWHKTERAARATLCARDEKLSGGRISAANGYKVTIPHSERPGAFVVSQELRAIKHTRREERLLAEKNWAVYCSEPRSEAEAMAAHTEDLRQENIARMTDAYDAEFGPKAKAKAASAAAPEPTQRPLGQEVRGRNPDEPTPRKQRWDKGVKRGPRKPKTVETPASPDG